MKLPYSPNFLLNQTLVSTIRSRTVIYLTYGVIIKSTDSCHNYNLWQESVERTEARRILGARKLAPEMAYKIIKCSI